MHMCPCTTCHAHSAQYPNALNRPRLSASEKSDCKRRPTMQTTAHRRRLPLCSDTRLFLGGFPASQERLYTERRSWARPFEEVLCFVWHARYTTDLVERMVRSIVLRPSSMRRFISVPICGSVMPLICYMIVLSVLSSSAYLSHASASSTSPTPDHVTTAPKALRLSLTDALGLFLSQNLDVLMAKYGIEYRKGQEVTARLFPNPVLSVGTQSSNTQGRTLSNSGQLFTQASQLFELAGKRGYRIESAGFGTQSAEAAFEDAVRQLGFTVKDTYYRVQLAQRRLVLAEENRERFSRILDI